MVRNTRGFTLIELLIVVVIIGILAAIAIPKFASTKDKAYVAAMKADLKNLVTANEAYFSDFDTYGAEGDLDPDYWSPSTNVSVTVTVVAAPTLGFTATASHANVTTTCTVCAGGGCGAGEVEGEVACTG